PGSTVKSSRPASWPAPSGPSTLAHVHSTLPGSTSPSRSPPQRQQRRGAKLRPIRSWRKRRACWSAYAQNALGRSRECDDGCFLCLNLKLAAVVPDLATSEVDGDLPLSCS